MPQYFLFSEGILFSYPLEAAIEIAVIYKKPAYLISKFKGFTDFLISFHLRMHIQTPYFLYLAQGPFVAE